MMLGKAVLDESHPLFIGLYEGRSSRDYVKKRVESADCLIVLGEWLTGESESINYSMSSL